MKLLIQHDELVISLCCMRTERAEGYDIMHFSYSLQLFRRTVIALCIIRLSSKNSGGRKPLYVQYITDYGRQATRPKIEKMRRQSNRV